MVIALTVAGSDSGGGAGIQADLKTFSALGVYGTSAITAITAQNTVDVIRVEPVSPTMIAAQIRAVFDDMDVRAVKIGMLGAPEAAAAVADTLELVLARRPGPGIPIVLDPVMIAKSGTRLIDDPTIAILRDRLLPMATVLTPNLPEAAALLGRMMTDDGDEIIAQAQALRALGPAWVLMKGGHGSGSSCIDRLLGPGEAGGVATGGDAVGGGSNTNTLGAQTAGAPTTCAHTTPQTATAYAGTHSAPARTGHSGHHDFTAPRIDTKNTHGTGCSMSSAIAAGLAQGMSVPEAVARAHHWLHNAIRAADRLNVGQGHGPVHHFHEWWGR